ncbi:MAG: metallophosphoesterase [Pseudomonadota bacterium]
MRLIHFSDLHLSRYGETGTWKQRDSSDEMWESLHVWQRWQIEGLKDKKGRPDEVRLVDPEGVVHWVRGWPKKNDGKVINEMLELAMERHRTSSENLIANRPSPEDLRATLQVDGYNTNLRFLNLLDQVLPLEPDLIVITGDITDNGFGYKLVRHYLKNWIDRERLLVIPGNHDTYDMFPRMGRKDRKAAKEERYRGFANSIGSGPNHAGAWVRRIGDIAVVGLSSCKQPRTLLSASGKVAKEQLIWLRELGKDPAFGDARLRIGLVHHHLLRMPFEMGKRPPIEVGLRLRNAAAVMETCTEAQLDMILNGHRHHGYAVKLPGHPMVISSPSSTLGCKSTAKHYVWMMDLGRDRPFPEVIDLKDDNSDY